MNNQETNRQNEPTEEEWRELGSAEVNAWTITPPGGKAMTLTEYAEHQAAVEAEKQENIRAMKADMDEELADRRAMENMTLEERAAYLAAKYPGMDYLNPLGE